MTLTSAKAQRGIFDSAGEAIHDHRIALAVDDIFDLTDQASQPRHRLHAAMQEPAPALALRRPIGSSSDQSRRYVSDWRLVEENQRAALATIVHGISRLDAAGHWGDGTTSASDGQRFAMPHKVLQRTYSTRFNDFALSGSRRSRCC